MADLQWYAPAASPITNLTHVLNGTGAFEFIYNSSQVPEERYGAYNWCNMPHVRKNEYNVPEGYRLRYVEVIHRHHKRTPYASNAFPIEPYPWDCYDQGLFYFGEPLPENGSSHTAARTYWNVYKSNVNPFNESGFAGSCQFPQITKDGLDDSWQHGVDLRGVYYDLLGFIPAQYDNKAMAFRVTNNIITSQVAGMVVNGIFKTKDTIPLNIQGPNTDSLEPKYSCPAGTTLQNSIRNTTQGSPWRAHLQDASTISLFSALDKISGVLPTSSDWHVSFDHYFDTLSARLCHQKPLPCNATLGACITSDQAGAVFRRGEYEYAFSWRLDSRSLQVAASSYGVWLAELTQNIRDVLSGNSQIRYRHNIAHDGSISPVLAFLQLDNMVWPGMGAEVVFEIWEKDNQQYLRVLWGGQTLQSSSPQLGLMNLIPLQRWLDYTDGLVGKKGSKVVALCSTS